MGRLQPDQRHRLQELEEQEESRTEVEQAREERRAKRLKCERIRGDQDSEAMAGGQAGLAARVREDEGKEEPEDEEVGRKMPEQEMPTTHPPSTQDMELLL